MTDVTISDTRWEPGANVNCHDHSPYAATPPTGPVVATAVVAGDRSATFNALAPATYQAIDDEHGSITAFHVDTPKPTGADLTTVLAQMQSQIDSNTQSIQNLTSDLSGLDTRLQGEIDANQQSIANLNNDLSFQAGRIDDLDTRVTALETP